MGKIDLHIHSNFSDDGELEVEDIVKLSIDQGMEAISICDHNSTRGVKRAIEYGNANGVEVIPGIEIDCTYNSIDLHVLGYFIDYDNLVFEQLEEDIFRQEKEAGIKRIRKLKENTGLKIDEKEVLEKANGQTITGELIAEVLLGKEENINNEMLRPYLRGGNRSDMPYVNFYWDFFSQDKIAYVPINYISLREAINIIKNSGGVPVIAHPGNNLKNNMDMIDSIIMEGICGIEAFSTYHTLEQTDYFYKKALEHNILVTCGSDFHGKNKPNIKIGECGCNLDYNSIIKPLKKLNN